MRERIVLLGRRSSATAILYHALTSHFDVCVIHEEPPSAEQLVRSRIRRLGLWRVFGQVLFQLLIAKPLVWWSKDRCATILREQGASDAAIPEGLAAHVRSVNDPACWELVRSYAPRAVVINGTRILSSKTITALGVPVLNTHVGITPMYRGVHGAYWALAQGDATHCGVTVHVVDEGVDTGEVLHQALITPDERDNFATYPVMQMAVGSMLMVKALNEVVAGTSKSQRIAGKSERWYHPTLWAYVRNYVRLGVK